MVKLECPGCGADLIPESLDCTACRVGWSFEELVEDASDVFGWWFAYFIGGLES